MDTRDDQWARAAVRSLLTQLVRRAASDLLRDAVRLTAAAERLRKWGA